MNPQAFRHILNHLAFLIPRIIKDDVDFFASVLSGNEFEKLANRYGIDISLVANHRDSMRDCIQCAQDVKPFTPGSGADKNTFQGVKITEKG